MAKVTKKELQENPISLGEISTIRNILMGQQMSEYEKRFGHLEEKLLNAQDQLSNRLETLNQQNIHNLQQLEDSFNQKIQLLQEKLNQETKRLDQERNIASLADKQTLGKMLIDLGKQLIQKK